MSAMYEVVGKGPGYRMFFSEFKELFGDQFEGFEDGGHLKKCLQGQPKLKGMAGPMYGGLHCWHPVVRYESWEAYDALSR